MLDTARLVRPHVPKRQAAQIYGLIARPDGPVAQVWSGKTPWTTTASARNKPEVRGTSRTTPGPRARPGARSARIFEPLAALARWAGQGARAPNKPAEQPRCNLAPCPRLRLGPGLQTSSLGCPSVRVCEMMIFF